MMNELNTRTRKPRYCTPMLVLLLLVSPVCTAAEATRTIWESGDEYVRLVARGGMRGVRNDHPVKISARTLSAVLVSLRAVPDRRRPRDTVVNVELSDAIPLFSQAAAQRLGKVLAVALRDAKPDEDIVFQSKDNAALFGFVSRPVHTTARLFWKGGRLHAVFGTVHKGIVKRMVMGRKVGLVNPPREAGRGSNARSDYQIALTPGVRHARTRDGKLRTNWIVIDADIAANEAVAEERPTTAKPAARRAAPARSLEDRLRRLKKLRRDGLISERDYRAKVREILDEL